MLIIKQKRMELNAINIYFLFNPAMNSMVPTIREITNVELKSGSFKTKSKVMKETGKQYFIRC